jgi:hypothetical protein
MITRLFFRYLSFRSLLRAIRGGPEAVAKRELRRRGHRLVRRIR